MPKVTRLALSRVQPVSLSELGRVDAGLASRLVAEIRALRERQPIKHLHLVGGGASGELSTQIARELTLPCTRSSDPLAPARAGARLRNLACVDLGRASIKSIDGIDATRIDRDLSRAPLRESIGAADLARARESTIALLVEITSRLGPQVLLGLPCRLVGEVPQGSTYAWRDPDPELLPELAKRADRTLEVVEDVELAALAAAENRLVPRAATTLVLSIGTDVRGSLLMPE